MRAHSWLVFTVVAAAVRLVLGDVVSPLPLSAFSINPGVKLAIDVGRHPGYVVVLEASAVYMPRTLAFLVGAVGGFEYNLTCRRPSFYYEGELGTPVTGGSIGREVWPGRSRTYARIYAGFFLYYSYRFYLGPGRERQGGLVLKLPTYATLLIQGSWRDAVIPPWAWLGKAL